MNNAVKTIESNQSMERLSPEEQKIGANVMSQCMGVQEGESVLVVCDTLTKNLAALFLESAKKVTKNSKCMVMEPRNESGQEPPQEVAEAMKGADVALLVTTHSLSHTSARRDATASGTRIASMPGLDYELVVRTLGVDYSGVKKLSDALAQILTKGKTVKITSPTGTDLRLDISGKNADSDSGIFTAPGAWGNLPAGEADLGPIEGKSQGILVVDGCSYHSGVELDKPITMNIKDGLVVDVSGGVAAAALQKTFDELGSGARNVAELGIGTNPFATLSGSILETEKVLGTIHIGLGNNMSYGGTCDVPFHSDGVVLDPTVTVDNKVIMKDGKLLV